MKQQAGCLLSQSQRTEGWPQAALISTQISSLLAACQSKVVPYFGERVLAFVSLSLWEGEKCQLLKSRLGPFGHPPLRAPFAVSPRIKGKHRESWLFYSLWEFGSLMTGKAT